SGTDRVSGRRRVGDVPAARIGRRGRRGHRLGPRGVGLRWLVRAGAGHGAGGSTRGGDGPGPGRGQEHRVLRAVRRTVRTIVRGRCVGVGGGALGEASPRRRGGGMIRRRWAGVLLVLAIVGTACTSGGNEEGSPGQSGGVNQRGFRIVVVTHGQASDPFWSVVANGVKDAAAD